MKISKYKNLKRNVKLYSFSMLIEKTFRYTSPKQCYINMD